MTAMIIVTIVIVIIACTGMVAGLFRNKKDNDGDCGVGKSKWNVKSIIERIRKFGDCLSNMHEY